MSHLPLSVPPHTTAAGLRSGDGLPARLRAYIMRHSPRSLVFVLQKFGITFVLFLVIFVHYISTHPAADAGSEYDKYDYEDQPVIFHSNGGVKPFMDMDQLQKQQSETVGTYQVPVPQVPQVPRAPPPPPAPLPVQSVQPVQTKAIAPPPLESNHPFYATQEERDGLHFRSSHPTRPSPNKEDNWVDSVDRPVFSGNLHDKQFSFKMDEQKIEEMNTHLPSLLDNYKNPCWYEEVPRHFSYNSSFFYRYYEAGLGQLPHGDWKTTFLNMENRVQFRKRQSRDGKGWRLRCYPYYFVLGFTKAGTTDFCRILHLFPSVFSGIKKEPQYWNKIRTAPATFPGERRSTRPTLADYLDLYDGAAEGIRHKTVISHGEAYHTGIVGDCDPQTVWQLFSWDKMVGNDDNSQPNYKTPHHLYSLNPKTKFIVLLRDPVERAFSHYRFFNVMKKNAATELDDFHENVRRTITLLEFCTRTKTTRECIHDRTLVPKSVHTSVTVGLYSIHLREWFNVFPREQFLFLKSEDYFEKRESAIRETIDFLSIDINEKDLQNIEDVDVINTNSAKTKMRHDTEKLLKSFYRTYNQDLANLLQDGTFTWGY